MKRIIQFAAVLLAACETMAPDMPKLEDGEIAMPTGYQGWPKFLFRGAATGCEAGA
jgi:hypothetical protein